MYHLQVYKDQIYIELWFIVETGVLYLNTMIAFGKALITCWFLSLLSESQAN